MNEYEPVNPCECTASNDIQAIVVKMGYLLSLVTPSAVTFLPLPHTPLPSFCEGPDYLQNTMHMNLNKRSRSIRSVTSKCKKKYMF